jgi:hypothetical protein
MQRVINNGSFLQAYALQEIIRDLGHTTEFIDFNNHLQKNVKKESSVIRRVLRPIKWFFIPKYRRYKKNIKLAELFRTRMTKEWFPLLYLEEKLNTEPASYYDVILVGSDEVFNLGQFIDGNVDIPWPLLGENLHCGRLYSYAASGGQTTIEYLRKHGLLEKTAGLLKQFTSISVRDENTYQLVKDMVPNAQVSVNIDPVLLFDFPADSEYKMLDFRYLLVYAYNNRINSTDEISAIRKFAHENNLKILCVNCVQSFCDITLVVSPFALLQYFKNAAYVVTDTFHGAIMSIKSNVPFAVFVRESNRNKLGFLLSQFNLTSRIIEKPDTLNTVLSTNVNYDMVNTIIDQERQKSQAFLKEMLDN